MKKIVLAAMTAGVLVTGAFAGEGIDKINYFVDSFEFNNHLDYSHPDDTVYIEMSADRAGCGGRGQRLSQTYGNYESVPLSHMSARGSSSVRKSFGHLCNEMNSAYLYHDVVDSKIDAALWAQAYTMSTMEKQAAKDMAENKDSNFKTEFALIKKAYMTDPQKFLETEAAGLFPQDLWNKNEFDRENSIANLFENLTMSAFYNKRPELLELFIEDKKSFVSKMKKYPDVVERYNWLKKVTADTNE